MNCNNKGVANGRGSTRPHTNGKVATNGSSKPLYNGRGSYGNTVSTNKSKSDPGGGFVKIAKAKGQVLLGPHADWAQTNPGMYTYLSNLIGAPVKVSFLGTY